MESLVIAAGWPMALVVASIALSPQPAVWVRAYSAPVEVDQPEHERGRYQHPELYGQGAEMALYDDAVQPQPDRTAVDAMLKQAELVTD